MINRQPEPRLEPDHQLEEDYDDEFGADFIQPPEEMSDEIIIDIYNWLIGLGQ